MQLYYQYCQITNTMIFLVVTFNLLDQYNMRNKPFIYLFVWRVKMINSYKR